MKCPLSAIHRVKASGKVVFDQVECSKENCAWWEPKIGKCSVLRMWIAQQDIHEVLHDIAKALTVK